VRDLGDGGDGGAGGVGEHGVVEEGFVCGFARGLEATGGGVHCDLEIAVADRDRRGWRDDWKSRDGQRQKSGGKKVACDHGWILGKMPPGARQRSEVEAGRRASEGNVQPRISRMDTDWGGSLSFNTKKTKVMKFTKWG